MFLFKAKKCLISLAIYRLFTRASNLLPTQIRGLHMQVKKVTIFLCFLFLLTTSVFAETYIITTEDYPPYNMRVNGADRGAQTDAVTGLSTEIVRELFTRTKIDFEIIILPWKRAIDYAEKNKNYGVYSTTRNLKREKHFRWVGPLAPNNWSFFGKKGSGIHIKSLKEAGQYRVGGYIGDALTEYIEEKGIPVDKSVLDDLNLDKLEKGRIDLWLAGNLLGAYRAQKAEIPVEIVFTFQQSSLWIAFNKKTPDAIIDQLNKTMVAIKKDGTINRIYQKYGVFQ